MSEKWYLVGRLHAFGGIINCFCLQCRQYRPFRQRFFGQGLGMTNFIRTYLLPIHKALPDVPHFSVFDVTHHCHLGIIHTSCFGNYSPFPSTMPLNLDNMYKSFPTPLPIQGRSIGMVFIQGSQLSSYRFLLRQHWQIRALLFHRRTCVSCATRAFPVATSTRTRRP